MLFYKRKLNRIKSSIDRFLRIKLEVQEADRTEEIPIAYPQTTSDQSISESTIEETGMFLSKLNSMELSDDEYYDDDENYPASSALSP